MALTVTQRPEEDLYVEENPTAYDTPYFTSRWNAANLPLVYKISNTKFPVNSEDAIESILTIETNTGFAQLNLSATTYTFLAKGTVKITNTTNYNGVWSIRSVIDANTIVIDAPFVASETGNVQNYFNNYSTLVKVYAGLPEYHPSNASKPMTLITDNPITVVPNASNIATVDVASLVKSKLSLDNNYNVNDLDQFTAFYIEYSEQYDESNGNTVNVTTETFVEDLIEGCDSGATEFVTNGEFTTNLNSWENLGTGESWFHDTDKASVNLSSTLRESKGLTQKSLNLTNGTEYAFTMNYVLQSENVTIKIINGGELFGTTIFEETLTGSGLIDFTFVADGADISIRLSVVSNPSTALTYSVDNVSITNQLINPCLAYIFSTHSALQPQSKYGGNIGEYVQNFNGGQFLNKWLTLMEKPTLFKGNYFDLSTIIPQSVIQSAVQSGGYFLEIVEYDVNGDVIAETQFPIVNNLGDGIYRFRLDNKTFQDKTKEFTVQILRIPVNLFVDGDQGTFDTTSNPNGNPPSDWNLEKDARAIINFEDTIVQAGAGALKFTSRSIFNDDYALNFLDSGQTDSDNNGIKLNSLPNVDITSDFEISLEFYPFSLPDVRIPQFNKLIDIKVNKGSLAGFFQVTCFENPDTNITSVQFAITLGAGGQFSFRSNGQLLKNSLNTITISFINATSASITVNGVTVNELIPALDFTGYTVSQNWEIGTGRSSGLVNQTQNIDGYIKNVQFNSGSVLRNNFKLNQEQGMQVFDSVTSKFNGELFNFTNQEVSFDGGAWVDTTTL